MFYSNDKLSIMPSQNPEPLSIAKLVNPQFNQAPPVDKTPALTKTFKPNRSTKSKVAGPLSKKEEKTDAQIGAEAGAEGIDSVQALQNKNSVETRFKDLLDKAKMLPQGSYGSGKVNLLGSAAPSPEDMVASLAQGEFARQESLGGAESVAEDKAMNSEILKSAMQDYLKKASNPYRGVDLENIDRMTASTFGGRLQGMKNVAEPTNEFNQVVGAKNAIQALKQGNAKEVMDYMQTILKPQNLGAFDFSNKPLPKPAGGRTAAQAQNADKYVLDTYRKVEEKNAPILQKFEQLKGNLKLGTMSAVKSSLPILAKTVGSDVGNIALQEAERYMPSTLGMSFSNLLSYMESDPNYQVPKDTVKAIQAYVTVAEKEFKKRVSDQYRMTNETLSKSPFYADPNSRFSKTYLDKAATSYGSGGSSRLQELLNKAKKK
jgi:hypothetical protein